MSVHHHWGGENMRYHEAAAAMKANRQSVLEVGECTAMRDPYLRNTRWVLTCQDDYDEVVATYYATEILAAHIFDNGNRQVYYYTGGYRTMSTRNRMNQTGPAEVQIQQHRKRWYMRVGDRVTPFYDHITVGGHKDRGFELERIPGADSTGVPKAQARLIRKWAALPLEPDASRVAWRSRDCALCAVPAHALFRRLDNGKHELDHLAHHLLSDNGVLSPAFVTGIMRLDYYPDPRTAATWDAARYEAVKSYAYNLLRRTHG
jgi:hypothetical protein